jgi:hypothetical protein
MQEVSVYLSSYSEAGRTRKVRAATPAQILADLGLTGQDVVITIAGKETKDLQQQLVETETVIISKGATKSGS